MILSRRRFLGATVAAVGALTPEFVLADKESSGGLTGVFASGLLVIE